MWISADLYLGFDFDFFFRIYMYDTKMHHVATCYMLCNIINNVRSRGLDKLEDFEIRI